MKEVAKKCDGYSGSDLEILAKDAAMEGIRFAQKTKHFKKVFEDGKEKFMPVSGPSDW